MRKKKLIVSANTKKYITYKEGEKICRIETRITITSLNHIAHNSLRYYVRIHGINLIVASKQIHTFKH